MLPSSVLIVDSLNTFLRGYFAYPAMDPRTGEQVGGIVGFVKSLTRMVNDFKPTRVVIVWEGGGSSRRRALFSEYKMHRKPEKMNRFYEDDIPDTEENKTKQIAQTLTVLKTLPFCQVYVPDVEADDVIAYLCKRTYADRNKIIVSTDKDMYQLLDDKTVAFNLNKKSFVTPEVVKKTYFIPPRNFALAKTLCGDPSDNIPGVKGLGFKTIAKRFPLLIQEDTDVLLQDVISYASARVGETPAYKRVAESADDLRRNWRLVYLDGSMISSGGMARVDHTMEAFTPKMPNKMSFVKTLLDAGALTHLDVDDTLSKLAYLQISEKASEDV